MEVTPPTLWEVPRSAMKCLSLTTIASKLSFITCWQRQVTPTLSSTRQLTTFTPSIARAKTTCSLTTSKLCRREPTLTCLWSEVVITKILNRSHMLSAVNLWSKAITTLSRHVLIWSIQDTATPLARSVTATSWLLVAVLVQASLARFMTLTKISGRTCPIWLPNATTTQAVLLRVNQSSFSAVFTTRHVATSILLRDLIFRCSAKTSSQLGKLTTWSLHQVCLPSMPDRVLAHARLILRVSWLLVGTLVATPRRVSISTWIATRSLRLMGSCLSPRSHSLCPRFQMWRAR